MKSQEIIILREQRQLLESTQSQLKEQYSIQMNESSEALKIAHEQTNDANQRATELQLLINELKGYEDIDNMNQLDKDDTLEGTIRPVKRSRTATEDLLEVFRTENTETGDIAEMGDDVAEMGDEAEATEEVAEMGDETEATEYMVEMGDEAETTEEVAEMRDEAEATEEVAEMG
eukprot:CAMPEP_0114389172 /NCGR_PEP_ID=MMETSP0102-20121206/8479_1 /TAXON_ID=38822 ORGANISM="Pteridomonas danica, Strain PT" /NCGR_SAMPLE_ID=MMETSP0102 /ASSEMBLY_ACC=CAM_ASM_000212 /LENGTH=174 /DNA_ID=CAMNT_0001546979 /DNA_START=269 /DNA_END=789 /DNA_ORIENTATION=-